MKKILSRFVKRVERFASEFEKAGGQYWEVLTADSGVGGDYVHYRRGTLFEKLRQAWKYSKTE